MNEQMKEILLSELYKLSPLAQKAVEELLDDYEERRLVVDAENFLHELPAVPMSNQKASNHLIAKLNWAIDVLRNSSRWFSLNDLPHETWRDVVGYKDFYQVSIFSRVKSFYGCKPHILKHHIDIDGYAVVSLSKGGKDRIFGVHTLVGRAFIDNPENKPVIHHQDSNRLHSGIWNLEWATYSENSRYAFQTGFRKIGSESPCAKLTAEQAQEVLRLYKKGDSAFGCTGLAKKFNVHPTTIHGIISGKIYKNIARNN